jgi:hypothetical protein
MAEAGESIATELPLSEALERISFEELRPYLHAGRIPTRHHTLYLLPSGVKWYQPGSIPLKLWFNALLEGGRHGRVLFFPQGYMAEGRVVDEQVFAYTIDIYLDRAAFEVCVPWAAAPVLNWRAGNPGWIRFPAPDKTKPSPEPAAGVSQPAAEARTTKATETPDDRPVEVDNLVDNPIAAGAQIGASKPSEVTPEPQHAVGPSGQRADQLSAEPLPELATPALKEASRNAKTPEPPAVGLSSPRMSREEQAKWLKDTIAANLPGENEPITPEGYGKRIADMALEAGAEFKLNSIITRYWQLNPQAPKRRKSRKRRT